MYKSYLREGWTVWINIHSGNIVRVVLTRHNTRKVDDLLSRGGEEGISEVITLLSITLLVLVSHIFMIFSSDKLDLLDLRTK